MGQKLMGHEIASKDAMISMGPDESVLILIKHCQDMKKQETCLRFITLLLLLSCVALSIFTIVADLKQRENSSGQGSAVEQSPAYFKQESVCPADNPKTNSKMPHIRLSIVFTDNNTDGQHITWEVMFGDIQYNAEKHAIVIPETGKYFVYMRIALSCQTEDGCENFKKFFVKLQRWNEGYDTSVSLTDACDGITCTSGESRSVFVGELFDLLAGDHLSVWIELGYKLIMKSSFGAYLT